MPIYAEGLSLTVIGVVVAVAVVILIAIIVLIWGISTSNTFKRMKVKVEEANSGIDVALNKRYDLLTKSLAATKGYAKHEVEALEKVVALRSGQNPANLSMKEKMDYNNDLAKVTKDLNILVEQYPDLKASQNFLELQKQSLDCEEHLQAARRVYNSNVSAFNQKRNVFPSSIIAKMIKFNEDLEFFQVEEGKREDVKFDF